MDVGRRARRGTLPSLSNGTQRDELCWNGSGTVIVFSAGED